MKEQQGRIERLIAQDVKKKQEDMNPKDEEKITVTALDLLYETPKHVKITLDPLGRFSREERDQLVEKLHLDMKNMDWYYDYSDMDQTYLRGGLAWQSLFKDLDSLVRKADNGLTTAVGLWNKYAPTSGVRQPDFLIRLSFFTQETEEYIFRKQETDIQWQHLPEEVRNHLHNKQESGDKFLLIPRFFVKEKGPDIHTFKELNDAIEFSFQALLTGRNHLIGKLDYAVNEIDQLTKNEKRQERLLTKFPDLENGADAVSAMKSHLPETRNVPKTSKKRRL
ncbi:MAG: hypothetical protein P0Y53_01480 [Candidatus Pseudobacter hemicellulosilyticus]|uniref:Uncharacterized protein n=1 Tax=Candidatus Pseudobacter hemicellulosilyticus TaxID=3121375 RepID=A0AAJ5WRU1_9BACT|nr:MAG: hypothetical protein P0Y53_01480 [Pseudobacter sp.]